MPRPIRIEYPNAFYHVMNRGRGRQNIFHSQNYFVSFLNCLSEANKKFDIVIHAYCLMSNHYHLIIETPQGNLSRAMRHINGVYTQRYNRLRKTDGPLFRGRFKSILIDEDSYLLNLNRYIHRNPIKLVEQLDSYRWSSYPSYLGLHSDLKCLNKTKSLAMITNDNLRIYRDYVESDNDDSSLNELYIKNNFPSIMGDKFFKKRIYDTISFLEKENSSEVKHYFNEHISSDKIIDAAAEIFNVTKASITNRQISRSKNNFPRKLAMHLCQTEARNKLIEIKEIFNLKNVGSVSRILYLVRKEIENDRFCKELDRIREVLYVI